jgi:putative GTP pyrophosphokinase
LKIDAVSFLFFINNDPIVKKVDKAISTKTNYPIYKDPIGIGVEDFVFKRLEFLNIQTIPELRSLLLAHENKIPRIAMSWCNNSNSGSSFEPGISIFYLCYYLIGFTRDEEYISSYLNEYIYQNIDEKEKTECVEKAKGLIKVIDEIEK